MQYTANAAEAKSIRDKEHPDYMKENLKTHLLLREREIIIDRNNHSDIKDAKALINCAIQAEKTQRAIEVCQDYLRDFPEDGELNFFLGKAYQVAGHKKEAKKQLLITTQASPGNKDAWLALSNLLSGDGKHKNLQKRRGS